MNPLMMMLLLGDDTSALLTKAEYTSLCGGVADPVQNVRNDSQI